MIHLTDFILEQLVLESGFDTSFQTADEYVDCFKSMFPKFDDSDEEFIRFVMDEVWDGAPETVPFRIDVKNRAVKLYRAYQDNENLIAWLSNHGITDVTGTSIKPGHITFKWGSGSINANAEGSSKIATDIQETITCMVFNEYFTHQKDLTVDDLKSKDWAPYNKYFTEKSYKGWLKTWVSQCVNIFSVMPKSNDLIAIHYADPKDPVAIELRKVHDIIRSGRKLSSKDAFDPTDIIVYSKSKSGNIISTMDECLNVEGWEDMTKALRAAITELYNNGSYVGVSLKKGSNFRPHFMNFEPAIGFENAHFTGKISIDPVYGFFAQDQNEIDHFMQMTEASKEYYKEIVKKYNKAKRNKSCVVVLDCDDEKNIKLNIRTNSSSYHNLLVLEPSLHKALAQMGKVPVEKWQSLLSESNPELANIPKDPKYDANDIVKKFEAIKAKFSGIQTTSDQLKHLIDLFGGHEKEFGMDNEIWACYLEINILYAIINAKDTSSVLRSLLLWAEKLGDDCLPYLLIMPTGK